MEWKGSGQNISSATGANTLAPRTHTCKQQKVRTQCLFDAQCKTQTVVISQIQISLSWRLVDIFVALLLAQQILSFFNFKRIFHGICAQSLLSQQQFDWQDVILCHLFCQRPWMKPEGFWRQIVTLRTDSSPREAKSLQHCQWLWRLPKANRGQQRPSNGSILYFLPQFLASLVALHVASSQIIQIKTTLVALVKLFWGLMLYCFSLGKTHSTEILRCNSSIYPDKQSDWVGFELAHL